MSAGFADVEVGLGKAPFNHVCDRFLLVPGSFEKLADPGATFLHLVADGFAPIAELALVPVECIDAIVRPVVEQIE